MKSGDRRRTRKNSSNRSSSVSRKPTNRKLSQLQKTRLLSDIEKYNLGKHLIQFKDTDSSRLKQIREYSWFKENKAWQREFDAMKKLGAKAEIQALSSRGISFISDEYLPEKIKNKDFLD